ncbi:hypothetical protein EV182_004688 [Spiromyces aspiralis]|uniref:Uncharacterized protein n=1 Tax=Spiromyces aspiralis TaxID=68401 RepID=A0ACC1HEQ7_9FUNG|nr:hypothetical protein EV182_004688 [Spiromyces aspiralis]
MVSRPVKVCRLCDKYLHMSIMSKHELDALHIRQLREYLTAYGLFDPSLHIEKADLIRAIYDNSPVTFTSEEHYRNHIPTPSSSVRALDQNSGSNFEPSSRDRSNDASSSNAMPSDRSRRHRPSINRSQQRRSYDGRPSPSSAGNGEFLRYTGNWNALFNELGTGILQSVEQAGERFSGFLNEILPDIDRYNSGPPPWVQNMDNLEGHHPADGMGRSSSGTRTGNAYNWRWSQPNSAPHRPQRTQQRQDPEVPSIYKLAAEGADVTKFNIKQLKQILDHYHVDYTNVLEKQELIVRVQRLLEDTRREMQGKAFAKHKPETSGHSHEGDQSDGGQADRSGDDEDDVDMCKICWDQKSNCAFLNCGHMCTCHDCADRLKATKNECPICREPIARIVRIFKA